jgi:hypothetical protein
MVRSIKKEAIKLVKEQKVNQLTERMFEVGDHTVLFVQLPGRTIVTCTCINHVRNCKQPAICKHKLAAIFVWMMRGIKDVDN